VRLARLGLLSMIPVHAPRSTFRHRDDLEVRGAEFPYQVMARFASPA
jgi:hypothetical protein